MDISIITPAFNLESYIKITYDSIESQKIEWEWIIVDDGSTDNTIAIIEELNDIRVRLVKSKHTGNLSVLRNVGASIATSELLAFIDGDDWYEKNALSEAIEYFKRNQEIDFCHTDTVNYIENTNRYEYAFKVTKLQFINSSGEYLSRILRSNPLTISSLFIRRQVFLQINGFNEKYKYCEDLDLWIRLLSTGYTIGFIKKPIVYYRIRETSLFTTKRLKYLKTNFSVYRDFMLSNPFLFIRNIISVAMFYSNNYYLIYKSLQRHPKVARRFLWLSILFDPRKLRHV